MPASDGCSLGEFLKTDGSGNLSFGSAAAGGKVLQVLFDGTSTNWSTSSTSYVDTDAKRGLSLQHLHPIKFICNGFCKLRTRQSN